MPALSTRTSWAICSRAQGLPGSHHRFCASPTRTCRRTSSSVCGRRVQKRNMSGTSIAIGALSTIVEWYDFTLYLYLATVLARIFFGSGNSGLMATLVAFAIAYFLRPLGGLFFGHIGDKFGRRRAMLLS